MAFELISVRQEISRLLEAGINDQQLIAAISEGNVFYPVECELIDYKEIYVDDP
jgi:hypothetical protein